MTVSNTNTKDKFTTNGVTVDFPFTFYLTNTQQVFAKLVDAQGDETDYTNFTVIKNPDNNGGTLTTNDVLDNTDLLIFRDTQQTQETDYIPGGRFPAESHEQALDKLTLINQEQQEELDRTLKSKISDEAPPVFNPEGEGILQLEGGEVSVSVLTVDEAISISDNAQFFEEIAESPQDTATSPGGVTQTTITGLATLAADQRDEFEQLAEDQRDNFDATFQAQFQYAKIGNISDFVGDSLSESDKLNSYQYPDDSNEWYGPIQNQVFPITIPADPSTDNGWALVNALTSDSLPLYTDIVYKASGGNSAVENMVAGFPIAASTGDICHTGESRWRRNSGVAGDISDFDAINGAIFYVDIQAAETFDSALDRASTLANESGGGTVILPSGKHAMSQSWDGRKYNTYESTTDTHTVVSISGYGCEILWRGGKHTGVSPYDVIGAYGTAFHCKRNNLTSGSFTSEGAFLGQIKGVRGTADQVQTGHLGGWSPQIGTITTAATEEAACKMPDQANYPINVARTNSNEIIPDDQMSCFIYYSGVSPTAIQGNSFFRFGCGIWSGIGFGTELSSNYGRWNLIGMAYRDAITAMAPINNTMERNAIGMFASVASSMQIENNVTQANYAGCDVLITQCIEIEIGKIYGEVSPKNIVMRGAGGDSRNSNIKLNRVHSLALDVDMATLDSLTITECLIARNSMTGDPEILIREIFGTAKDTAQVIVRDNRIPFTGMAPQEEMYPLFTEWPGVSRKWIYCNDTIPASESLTESAYYGREQNFKAMLKTEVSADFFEIAIPNEACSGMVRVRVQKSRPEDATANTGTLYDSTYYVAYSRLAGANTLFTISTTTDGPGEIKADPSGPDVGVKLNPINLTGGSTGIQKLTFSEQGARLSAGAYNVTLDCNHYASTGKARIKGLI